MTAVGLGATAACAAIRAGIARPSPIDFRTLDLERHERVKVTGYPIQMVTQFGAAAKKWGFVAAPPEPEEKPKKDEQEPAPEHASDEVPAEAILCRKGRYAQRGHDFLKANAHGVAGRKVAPRAVYAEFTRPYLEKIKPLLEEHAAFPGGRASSFNPGARSATTGKLARQRFPYPWEAHHLVPDSAFDGKGEDGEPAFTAEALEILKQTPYDLNHGHNIIMLPKLAWGVPVHALLQHPSDHPEYTLRTIKELRRVGDRIKALKRRAGPHEAVVASFFKELCDLENGNWNFIVKLSRAVVNDVCAGVEFVGPHAAHVRFESKSTGARYQFGRLY